MTDIVVSTNIRPSYCSDHSIIELNLGFEQFLRYKGRWQMNISHLKDSSYLRLINNAIDNEIEKYAAETNVSKTIFANEFIQYSPGTVLEMVIMRCRQETIKFSRKKRNSQKFQEEKLLRQLTKLENANSYSQEIESIKQKLVCLREEEVCCWKETTKCGTGVY